MKDIIVLDDFYAHPQAVREYALSRVDYLPSSALPEEFPGTESRQSFFNQAVIERMQNAIGERILVNPQKYSFGVFAKAFAKDARKRVVHVDNTGWTALVYLNPSAQAQGGTYFYRHRGSGMDRMPSEASLKIQGFSTRQDFIDRFLRPISTTESAWVNNARVGMKFNRMVLFRAGELFHAAADYFGTNDHEARLIQLFFFETEGRTK